MCVSVWCVCVIGMCVCEWCMCEWNVCECVECVVCVIGMCVWVMLDEWGVCEWEDRREEGGADTALKTKTPHVNVGKNGKPIHFIFRSSKIAGDFVHRHWWHLGLKLDEPAAGSPVQICTICIIYMHWYTYYIQYILRHKLSTTTSKYIIIKLSDFIYKHYIHIMYVYVYIYMYT